MITPDVVLAHNLTLEEYDRIVQLLGRAPNLVELGMFSALWSEHCSYKSSKVHLRRFPTEAPWVVQGPGENAGVIDIGHGLTAVFKIESHNHPSFVEPFQGAATGVGGILRDVFAMGARPIALMDALRFGPLDVVRNRLIMHGVVAGIAHYGNCVGVPTVGGDVYFEPCYSTNPLVNVFCLGIAPRDRLHFARARHPGRSILYVGSETGRDGIHGANILASRAFDETAEAKRPSVQIGDPFMEKILMEACLEIMQAGLVEAIQDMGAAGLTSSAAEMAARGGCGVVLFLDRVPLREPGLTPYEIMLSESQERMLLILKEGAEAAAEAILRRWGVAFAVVGRLTDDGRLRLRWQGEWVADVPVAALVSGHPVYDRPQTPYTPPRVETIPWEEPSDLNDVVRTWILSEDFASRRWIYRQYDHMVQINTVRRPGHDAAVLRVKGTPVALAMTLDGNGRLCYVDPFVGGLMAVAEAARNVTAVGARPMALTDCLNFGSPENPPVMWQFRQVIEGMREACLALGVPVVSGNVSFYNETEGRPVYPTPVVGMVGLIEDMDAFPIPIAHWTHPGDAVYLVGRIAPVLTGSTWARQHGVLNLGPLPFDIQYEVRFQAALRQAIRRGWLHTVHDVSDGGLLWTLVEASLLGDGDLGWDLTLDPPAGRLDAFLCSEIASAAVVALPEAHRRAFEMAMDQAGIEARYLGRVTDDGRLRLRVGRTTLLRLAVRPWRRRWLRALEDRLRLDTVVYAR